MRTPLCMTISSTPAHRHGTAANKTCGATGFFRCTLPVCKTDNITDCIGLCTYASMPGHRTTLVAWKLTSRVEGSGVQSCTERNNRAQSENTLQLFKQFRSSGFHQMLPNFKQLNKLQAIRCCAAWRRPLGIMLSPSLPHSSYQAPHFTLVIHLQHEFHQQGGSGYICCYRDLGYRHICIFRVAFFFYWQLIKLA